jgi:uncharacterized protein YbcI
LSHIKFVTFFSVAQLRWANEIPTVLSSAEPSMKSSASAAEKQLVKTLPAEKGRELLKQVRTQLIETARPIMEAMIQNVTDVKVLSLHHDISTLTGEEIIVFTLAQSPGIREAKKK